MRKRSRRTPRMCEIEIAFKMIEFELEECFVSFLGARLFIRERREKYKTQFNSIAIRKSAKNMYIVRVGLGEQQKCMAHIVKSERERIV